jgi:hypothetical protein
VAARSLSTIPTSSFPPGAPLRGADEKPIRGLCGRRGGSERNRSPSQFLDDEASNDDNGGDRRSATNTAAMIEIRGLIVPDGHVERTRSGRTNLISW